MSFFKLSIICLVAVLMPSMQLHAQSGGTLYASVTSQPLLILDQTTSEVTQVGPATSSNAGLTDLTFDPTTNRLLGTIDSSLVEVDRMTGVVTNIGSFGQGRSVLSIVFDPSTETLFGIDTRRREFLQIDRFTGSETVIGDTGLGDTFAISTLAYDPTTDTILGGTFARTGLFAFERTTGEGRLVAETSTAFIALEFDTSSNRLLGLPLLSGELVNVDPLTGSETAAASFGQLPFTGLAFIPNAIPEPASVALLGLGCVLASCRRRRGQA